MRILVLVVLFLAFSVSPACGESVKTIRLVVPPEAGPIVENVGRVFARQVQNRCDAKVARQGEASLTVELAIEPGIGDEGFKIIDGDAGSIRVVGNDARGVLYGVGKLLHTSTYDGRGFTPSAWRGVSVPKMSVRGIYFATHFQNFYEVAPLEDVQRYFEEQSLWGTNSLLLWFGMEEFEGIDDPKAQAMLARLRALLKIAKDLGLNTCLGCICNDGYKNSPVELRAQASTENRSHYKTKMGSRIYNLGNELCPSKPGVPVMEMGYCREKFAAFEEIGLDYWFIWPYDNGGCTCPDCSPWGANGYLRMAEPLAKAYKEAFPKGKVILGTWYFDRWGIGEWDGISAKFNAKKPDWIDYLMCDNFEEYPRYPLEHGSPGGLPMLNFPDISMYGQDPWGGYGANPHPGRLQARWDETKQVLLGGFPYSEGIYEDMNKVICTRLYWEPDRPAMETVKEYAAYEFSPEVADDVATIVKIFEENHYRNKIGPSTVTAYKLTRQVDAKLTPQSRRSWRWRLFCIRAAIDQEIYRNTLGIGCAKVFREAFEELTAILQCKNAYSMLRPTLIPAVNVEGAGLPSTYAEAIAESQPIAWWRMNDFNERDVADATENRIHAIYENGVTLGPPNHAMTDRAASLSGGRIKATVKALPDTYSVEFWFYNNLPNNSRPVTAYLFSRGPDGPEGTPGDSLGISGTSAVDAVPPGRMFFFNGDPTKLTVGKATVAPETWNHVVLVRDGSSVRVYLNGRADPEISAELPKGYRDGVTQVFLGGRNDNFGNLQGKIAEISLYGRILTSEEVIRHYKSAEPNRKTSDEP
jgi:hypothetical protein